MRCSVLGLIGTSAPTPPLAGPAGPIMIEVHYADGAVAVVYGVIDRVRWPAGENAQRVVVDAFAKPPQFGNPAGPLPSAVYPDRVRAL